MPPIRNFPSIPIKPVKTERTHEENQERAYIAASRRSDRSLEARIESARRASEIHKRRTGRSLRVREEDVINEEMYEEEDDDLPQQYRRLTAHLATSNTEFDRRLRAYLTNQVAMRSVFGQAVAGGFPVEQPFSATRFLNPSLMGPPVTFSNSTIPSSTAMNPSSPISYRQSPYPTSSVPQTGRPNIPNRSHSVASPTHIAPYPVPSPSALSSPLERPDSGERRMSMPAVGTPHEAPQTYTHMQNVARVPSPGQSRHDSMSVSNDPLNPISTTLPLESQQLLAGGAFFNFNDPFTGMMNQEMDLKLPLHKQQQTFSNPQLHVQTPLLPTYSYNPNGKGKNNAVNPQDINPSLDGLDQTLWGFSQAEDPLFGGTPTTLDPLDDFSAFDGDFPSFGGQGNEFASGHITPCANKEEWDSFLHGDAYDDPTVG